MTDCTVRFFLKAIWLHSNNGSENSCSRWAIYNSSLNTGTTPALFVLLASVFLLWSYGRILILSVCTGATKIWISINQITYSFKHLHITLPTRFFQPIKHPLLDTPKCTLFEIPQQLTKHLTILTYNCINLSVVTWHHVINRHKYTTNNRHNEHTVSTDTLVSQWAHYISVVSLGHNMTWNHNVHPYLSILISKHTH